MFGLTVTNFLILANVIISIKGFKDPVFFRKYDLEPYMIVQRNQKFRMISHAFLHGSWMHLFINMFVLWQFGNIVEMSLASMLGEGYRIYYLLLYFGAILVSAFPSVKKHKNDPMYAAIGASGAVAAVLFSYILMYPLELLYLFGILPIPAVVLGVLYLWYEQRMSRQGNQDHVAHDAHYWGGIFGFVITIAFKPELIVRFFDQLFSFF